MNLLFIVSIVSLMAATGFVAYWTAVGAVERQAEGELSELRDEIAFLKSFIHERNAA